MFSQQSFYFKSIDLKDKDHNLGELEITEKHTICILMNLYMFFSIKGLSVDVHRSKFN